MGALTSLKHDISVTTDMHGGCIDLAASKTAFAVEEEVTFWWPIRSSTLDREDDTLQLTIAYGKEHALKNLFNYS